MRDFKNPYYDGPDCVCCKSKVAEERERIIKLLEDNWVEPMDWLSVIALIKGETK